MGIDGEPDESTATKLIKKPAGDEEQVENGQPDVVNGHMNHSFEADENGLGLTSSSGSDSLPKENGHKSESDIDHEADPQVDLVQNGHGTSSDEQLADDSDGAVETTENGLSTVEETAVKLDLDQKEEPEETANDIVAAVLAASSSQAEAERLEQTEPAKSPEKDGQAREVSDHTVRVSLSPHPDGPDHIVETEALYSTQPFGAVVIRNHEGSKLDVLKPISVPTFFREQVKKFPSRLAMVSKVDGERSWTWAGYLTDIERAAKSLIHLGLKFYHSVGIIGFNSPEWFITNFAAIFAGGLSAGIYTTNSPAACKYVLVNSRSQMVVVENEKQLEKIEQIWDECPLLKTAIVYKPDRPLDKSRSDRHIISWQEFMELGSSVTDEILAKRQQFMAINRCASLIYTSGTTGDPKGVMLSHDNITFTLRAVAYHTFNMSEADQHTIISYLPLSHVAAQMLDMYLPLGVGGCTYFARPDALKGSLSTTMKEVRPTVFLGVPRVWEKIQEKMVEVARQNSGLKRSIARWAKSIGLEGNLNKMHGRSVPFGWSLANALVFKKVRLALGLDRCKFCLTGAAPLMKETNEFFLSLDIPLLEIYGMSESSGPQVCTRPDRMRLGAVGSPFFGAKTYIHEPDSEGQGEICMIGRHVFMGYLGMDEKTVESIDSQGRLHSGDLGKEDESSFLYITGRIKELVITAGGENIPPVLIEDTFKQQLPRLISNCMVVGDHRKFLSLLITLKVNMDEDGNPTDELLPDTRAFLAENNCHSKTVTEILESTDSMVMRLIQRAIDTTNRQSTSQAQQLRKWTLLAVDFSIPGGELGPTLKLKRPYVLKKFKKTIDNIYDLAEQQLANGSRK